MKLKKILGEVVEGYMAASEALNSVDLHIKTTSEEPEDFSKGHLWYNPVTDLYLQVEYLVDPATFLKTWRFGWMEEPEFTTWISFNGGSDLASLTAFLADHEDSKYGMLVPFKYKRIDGENRVLIDHILGERFNTADLDEIKGLYV